MCERLNQLVLFFIFYFLHFQLQVDGLITFLHEFVINYGRLIYSILATHQMWFSGFRV